MGRTAGTTNPKEKNCGDGKPHPKLANSRSRGTSITPSQEKPQVICNTNCVPSISVSCVWTRALRSLKVCSNHTRNPHPTRIHTLLYQPQWTMDGRPPRRNCLNKRPEHERARKPNAAAEASVRRHEQHRDAGVTHSNKMIYGWRIGPGQNGKDL